MMKSHAIDLHNHMPLLSDYRGPASTSPRDIVRAALQAGLDLFAVTDHLTVNYFSRMQEAARAEEAESGRRLCLLPGLELRLLDGEQEVHLVALFPEDELEERVGSFFARIGFSPAQVDEEDMTSHLLHRDPVEVAEAAGDMGGFAHLAHVDRYLGGTRLIDSACFDRVVCEAPLLGVDLIHPVHAAEVARRAPGIALLHSSDSHSLEEVGRRSLRVDLLAPSLDGLAQALAARGRLGAESALADFRSARRERPAENAVRLVVAGSPA